MTIRRVRHYRSSEGYTYAQPLVVLGGVPNGHRQSLGPYANGAEFNFVGPILKRTSATNYIDVRFNGSDYIVVGGVSPPQNVFEIWVSGIKRAGGSPASYPRVNDTYIRGWLDANNQVRAELWAGRPPELSATVQKTTAILLVSLSYTLNASEITNIGTGVVGQPGIAIAVSALPNNLETTAAVWYFRASRYDIQPTTVAVPVIGDIDAPLKIQLRGDVVNPTLTLTTPSGVARQISIVDTFTDANAVTIDSATGTIVDAAGVNRYGGVQPGSKIGHLEPGVNYLSLLAANWSGLLRPHAIIAWRDALR